MINELDARVNVLCNELIGIFKHQKPTNSEKGDAGESFAKRGIKQVFFDKGFYAIRGSNKTFTVEKQINPTKSKQGGIDFYPIFKINSKDYKLFFEIKNWGYYPKGIPPTIYKDEILDRFTKNDPQRIRYWILAMNIKNIPNIQKKCNKDKINIIPIDGQILPGTLLPGILNPIFRMFVDEFSKLVDDIISGKVTP